MRRLTIIISSLLALAAVAAVTRAGDAPAAAGDLENGITVQGTASVTAVPDRASLWIGVESQGETARGGARRQRRRDAARARRPEDRGRHRPADAVRQPLDATHRDRRRAGLLGPQLGVGDGHPARARRSGDRRSGGGGREPDLGAEPLPRDPERLYRQALAAAVADARVEGSSARERRERLARPRHRHRRGRLGAVADAAGRSERPRTRPSRPRSRPASRRSAPTVSVTFSIT